jgi:lipopolysaccharide transport system permease protein
LVLSFIFRVVLTLRIPNYTSFLLTGLLAWSWFQSSLYQATGAIVDNRELIKRPGFPAAILPMVTVAAHLIHFLLALPILLAFLIVGGRPLTGAVFALPVVIILQFILTLGLAYFVATFHVPFRDTQYLLSIILLLVFYLTPVFYDAGAIPERYRVLYHLNPMVHLIGAYRAILIQGILPNSLTLLSVGLFAAGVLFFGYLIFMRANYRFVDEL